MANTYIKAGQFSGVIGNGTDGYFLMSNGDGTMTWSSIITNPAVTSLAYPGSATAADPDGGETITVTGTGFKTGATVTVGGTAAPAVSYVSETQITFTTPAKAAGDYDIVVTNTDTGSATYINGISYNGVPTWTTAAGSLGTFDSGETISTITLQATEPDAGTITFNITNGALPTGLSLTGAAIDGTTSLETADTLYTFTVTATDDESQATPRTFTITVKKEFKSVEHFTINTYTGNGSTQSVEGKIGTAASFNGSSSKIVTSNIGAATGDISISAWVYFNSVSGTEPIVCRDSTATTRRLQFRNNAGTINAYWFHSGGLSALDSNTSVVANQWYHVVTSWEDGVANKIYINGSLDATDSTSIGTRGSLEYITIGYLEQGNTFLDGKIDQVRIFDKALSSSEVTTLYGENNDSSTKSTTDIFDDGSGIALYEFEEGAKDTGGVNGYIGAGGVFANPTGNKIGHSISLNANFSVSFWINISSYANTYYQNTTGDIIGFGGDNANGIWISSYGGKFSLLRGSTSGGQAISTNTNVPVNTWAHVVVSYSNGNTTSFYVNGSAAGTFNHTTTTTSTGTGIFSYIGDSDYPTKSIKSSFTGKIDQIRIFDKAISSSEVTTLYGETSASATKSTTDIFDDGSGVALYELEGNANDTGKGAIDEGQSAVFDGSSSSINTPPSMPTGSAQRSVSAWVKTTVSNANMTILMYGSGANNNFFIFRILNGQLGLAFYANDHDFTATGLTDGNWHHVVGTYDGSLAKLYLDGNLIGTGSAGAVSTNASNVGIGAYNNGIDALFNGSIDQVRMYNTALSASDVTNLYNESSVPTANLVAHYKLDGNANDSAGSYNGTATSITYSDPAEYPVYNGTATNVAYGYNGTPTNVGFVGTSFQPDLVWVKNRDYSPTFNLLFDSVRGATKWLSSNSITQEGTIASSLTSFDSNGFSLGADPSGSNEGWNRNGDSHVAWCWKAGGTAVSNTDGTITSTVSANQDSGFSIVKYTANATSGATIGHGLNQELDLLIVKSTNLGQAWNVYVKDVTDTSSKYLRLNETSSISDLITANSRFIPNNFTDSVFSVGNDNSTNGISGTDQYIAYCFHSVDGYQKVGSYTGNGTSSKIVYTDSNGDGTGTGAFQPRWLMTKRTDSSVTDWHIWDNIRNPSNPLTLLLIPNEAYADANYSAYPHNFLSNGFEVATNNATFNALNGTYIYLAIA